MVLVLSSEPLRASMHTTQPTHSLTFTNIRIYSSICVRCTLPQAQPVSCRDTCHARSQRALRTRMRARYEQRIQLYLHMCVHMLCARTHLHAHTKRFGARTAKTHTERNVILSVLSVYSLCIYGAGCVGVSTRTAAAEAAARERRGSLLLQLAPARMADAGLYTPCVCDDRARKSSYTQVLYVFVLRHLLTQYIGSV
jgi:hypothetical protein